MKIRTKLSLQTACLIAAVVSAVAVTVIRAERNILTAQSRERLGAVSEGVARLAEESVGGEDPFMLVSYLMFLRKDHPELSFASVTLRGHTSTLGADGPGLVYWSQALPVKHPIKYTVSTVSSQNPAQQLSVSTAGVSLNVTGQTAVNVEESGSKQFVNVTLGFSKGWLDAEVDRGLRPLLRRTVAIAGAFMLLGFLGAWSLAHHLSAPLLALSSAVGMIKEGKLDVTVPVKGNDEIAALGRKFNLMTGRLGELVQFREDIMHTLTHELNTPLGGLKSYLELWLDRKLPESSARTDVLETMMAAVLRMEQSLGSALRLFRTASGAGDSAKKVIWVEDMVRQVCTLFAMTAQAKGVTIVGIPETTAECVYADEEFMRQVVTNLISNAIKYTADGGTVRLSLAGDESVVRFQVSDSGRGIAPEDIPHLFTKFYRSGSDPRAGERIPGTGLGLSIAHKAVQAMGGTITVESVVGKGTTFRVTIPKPAPEAL